MQALLAWVDLAQCSTRPDTAAQPSAARKQVGKSQLSGAHHIAECDTSSELSSITYSLLHATPLAVLAMYDSI